MQNDGGYFRGRRGSIESLPWDLKPGNWFPAGIPGCTAPFTLSTAGFQPTRGWAWRGIVAAEKIPRKIPRRRSNDVHSACRHSVEDNCVSKRATATAEPTHPAILISGEHVCACMCVCVCVLNFDICPSSAKTLHILYTQRFALHGDLNLKDGEGGKGILEGA